jgi:hypothetical protein
MNRRWNDNHCYLNTTSNTRCYRPVVEPRKGISSARIAGEWELGYLTIAARDMVVELWSALGLLASLFVVKIRSR